MFSSVITSHPSAVTMIVCSAWISARLDFLENRYGLMISALQEQHGEIHTLTQPSFAKGGLIFPISCNNSSLKDVLPVFRKQGVYLGVSRICIFPLRLWRKFNRDDIPSSRITPPAFAYSGSRWSMLDILCKPMSCKIDYGFITIRSYSVFDHSPMSEVFTPLL